MTQEDKDLLFKDLSARLPYGVKIQIPTSNSSVLVDLTCSGYCYEHNVYIEDIKPYLRPMSSMTKKEKATYTKFRMEDHIQFMRFDMERTTNLTHYCYSRHLDVSHLIEKGLALEAPEGMYKTE